MAHICIFIVRKVFCLLSGNSRLVVFFKPSFPICSISSLIGLKLYMMMATPGSDKMGRAKAEFFVAHFGVVLVDEWFLGVYTMRFYV